MTRQIADEVCRVFCACRKRSGETAGGLKVFERRKTGAVELTAASRSRKDGIENRKGFFVENKLLSSVKAGAVGACVFGLSQAAVAANVQISAQAQKRVTDLFRVFDIIILPSF